MAKEKKRWKPTLIGFQIEHFDGACLDMTRKVGEPNVNKEQEKNGKKKVKTRS